MPMESDEVQARMEAIEPVVVEKDEAAVDGRAVALSGAQRLRWNIAEHVGFGEGASFMEQSVVVHRRRQRGRRRASPYPLNNLAPGLPPIGKQAGAPLLGPLLRLSLCHLVAPLPPPGAPFPDRAGVGWSLSRQPPSYPS